MQTEEREEKRSASSMPFLGISHRPSVNSSMVLLFASTPIYLCRYVHRRRPGTTYTACGVNKNAEHPLPSDTHHRQQTTLSSFLSSVKCGVKYSRESEISSACQSFSGCRCVCGLFGLIKCLKPSHVTSKHV